MSLLNTDNQIQEGRDFISQVATFMFNSTKTSYSWAECVATSMLSTVMGSKRYISDVIGKLPLNVWYMCVGPSGLAKKTVPLKNYLTPIMIRVGQDEKLVMPNRFSVEGYIKWISEQEPEGIMIRDEFTGLLKEGASKDYIVDLLEFLSELYDGTLQKRATIAHKLNEIKHCYLTFITATTPYLYKVMRPEFYTQGTGNRMLVELFDVDSIKESNCNPDEFFQGRAFDRKRDNFIFEVATILNEIRKCNARVFVPDDEAALEWTMFENECTKIAKSTYRENMYNLHYSYLARSAEMALKLSGLYTVSRKWDMLLIDDAPDITIIEKVDMERAIKKSKYHYRQFCRMLEQWRSRPEKRVFSTLHEQADGVYYKLRQTRGPLNWTELRRTFGWDDYSWRNVLKYLHDTERIRVTFGSSTKRGGRRPTLFYDDSDATQVEGDVVKDWSVIQQKLKL